MSQRTKHLFSSIGIGVGAVMAAWGITSEWPIWCIFIGGAVYVISVWFNLD